MPTDPGTANLTAHWPLDNDYDDAAGNGYDAVAGGNPSFAAGHIEQSVDFDGASYLNCQNSTGMDLDQGLTISAWIKSSGLSHSWASVVTKGIGAWRLIRNNNTSSISFHFNSAGGGEYQANGSTGVLDDEWHHLMAAYDGGEIRLYVDGQLDASASAGPVSTTNDPVYIGSRVNRISDRSWNGQIDEVRIYNTALGEATMLYLAEADPVVQIPSPRPADLFLDGVIDIKDLQILVSAWLQKVSWP
jgi:hypothetical protein